MSSADNFSVGRTKTAHPRRNKNDHRSVGSKVGQSLEFKGEEHLKKAALRTVL